MKAKTLISIISLMIFSMALLTGFAIIAILLLGRQAQNATLETANLSSGTGTLQQEAFSASNADFIYLGNNMDNAIVRVGIHDGKQQSISLGLSENTTPSGNFAFSPDGRLVAFCSFEHIEESSDNIYAKRTFIVRDLQTGANLIELAFGGVPGCNATAFSPDGSTAAASLVFNSPVENFTSNPNEPNWTLRLFDVNSGSVVREMSADSSFTPKFEDFSQAWFNPELPSMIHVLYYGNNELFFTAYPFYGGDGPIEVPAFRWDFSSNTVREVPNLGNFGSDYLPSTGEIIFPVLDESLPYAEPMGPTPRANTLQISDSNGTRVIYRNTEWSIGQAQFVEGGAAIAVRLLPDYNPTAPNAGTESSRIEIIKRDGTVQKLNNDYIGLGEIHGTNEGFIFQWTEYENNPPTFHVERYDGQSTRSIWTFTPETNSWLQMIWSPSMNTGSFAPFVAAN